MARYTGPTWKQARRLKYSVLETGKELQRIFFNFSETEKLVTKHHEDQKISDEQFEKLYQLILTGYEKLRLAKSNLSWIEKFHYYTKL